MTTEPKRMAYRVIVCGSRRLHHRWRNRIADRLFDLPVNSIVITGKSGNADNMAEDEARKLGLLTEGYHYREFISDTVGPKRAPLVRNEYMADLGADLCIAYWDGSSSGTKHMIDTAKSRGIPVEVITE